MRGLLSDDRTIVVPQVLIRVNFIGGFDPVASQNLLQPKFLRKSAGPACDAPCPALFEVAVGKTKVGPTPIFIPVSLAGHRRDARSNNWLSPNSVLMGARV